MVAYTICLQITENGDIAEGVFKEASKGEKWTYNEKKEKQINLISRE